MARIDIPPGDGDELTRMWAVNPEMGKIAGTFSAKVYGNTNLDVRERELTRFRIALINQCPVCLDTRAADMPGHGLTEDDYTALADWRSSDRFSAREKLAIEYAELFATDHLSMDEHFWDRMRSEWKDDEILDLTVCVASWLGLGRLVQVLGPQHACRLEI